MRRRLSIASLCTSLFAVLLFLSGCAGGVVKTSNNPLPGNPPLNPGSSVYGTFSVASIMPSSGATGVALDSTIQITFSGAANPSTVNTSNIQVIDPNPISGTVTYDSSNDTATFTPSAALVTNTTYTVTVSGVTSSGGVAMASPFKSTFATGSSSGGGGATLQYQATLLGVVSAINPETNPGSGQVSMDTSGKTTVQLTSASPSTTFSVQFCPAFLGGTNGPNCFTIGSLSTDASGSGTAAIQFPKTGSWAGDFELFSSTNPGPNPNYETDVEPAQFTSVPIVFMATMQPFNTVNGGTLVPTGQEVPQSPLASGTVTYSNGSVQFSLTGGVPNIGYTAGEVNFVIGGSDSFELTNSQGQSAFQTDAKGNVTFSVVQDGSDGDLFSVGPQNGQAGYIGGFSVPQFQATLLGGGVSGANGNGSVAMDTSGKTTVLINGASPNTTYSVQFCAAFVLVGNNPRPPCLPIGSLATNASGSGTQVIQFPKSGSWAGDFQLISSTNPGPTPDYFTSVGGPSSESGTPIPIVFMATMQPMNTVNGGALVNPAAPMPQDPLTSGTVIDSNGSVQFSLTGAVPNSGYSATQTFIIGGSESFLLQNSQAQIVFQTDANGNVTFSVLPDGSGDLFQVGRDLAPSVGPPQTGFAGSIGGFSVP